MSKHTRGSWWHGGAGCCVKRRETEDDHGEIRGGRLQRGEGIQPLAVGEPEVEQHQIEIDLRQPRDGLGEAIDVLDLVVPRPGLLEGLLDQPGVARVVLDQQDPNRICTHLRAHVELPFMDLR